MFGLPKSVLLFLALTTFSIKPAAAEKRDAPPAEPPQPLAPDVSPRQAELEKSLAEMLSGATLEGSFTNTAEGSDPTKLSREKYTLGEVKKLEGDLWQIPARIQYGEHDVTIPLALPVQWAGDTPVIVVDNVGLPGFGAVSARVMFFADHYMGYWKHGANGGHLFGVIHRDEDGPEDDDRTQQEAPGGSGDPARAEQIQQQPGQQ